MNTPVRDPPIPYVDNIQGVFSPKSLVRIQGSTPGISYRFNINLQCGPTTSPQDDIAIQISVRILEGVIVLNSLQHGIWGEEQVNTKLPIKRSERFEIIILSQTDSFKVAINSQHYCEFFHRIPYDRITHLAIDGDVSIIQISYEKTSVEAGAGASAPRPVAPIANEVEDFEIVDNIRSQSGYQTGQPGFQPLPPGIHPPSSGGFNDPPPYDEIVHGKQFQPFPNNAPYPSGPGYQAGYPPPTVGFQPASYPPPSGGYPSGAYPPVAPVPLNAAGSNFRPVKRDNVTLKRCCTFVGILVIMAILIIVVLVTKSKKTTTFDKPSTTYYNYDNNNNNNFYDNNNNNNYYDNNYWSKN